MKTIILLTLSLLGYDALADPQTQSNPAVFYLTSDYQQQASAAWQKRPSSFDDPWWLDQFIATYPHSEETPLAFTLRFAMTRGTRSIAAYESFITTYPHTLASQQAIYELFSLYCNPQREDLALHLKGCFTFMLRYSNTPHALVAQAEAQKTAFIRVTQADKLAGYEEYLTLFPNAPQTVTVEKMALNKAVADEQQWLTEQLGRLPEYNQQQLDTLKAQILEQDQAEQNNIISTNQLHQLIQRERNKRANTLATQFGTLAHQQDVLEAQWQQQYGSKPIDTATELGQTLKQVYSKILRVSRVLREVYSDTEAAREVRDEERHQNLLNKLEAIHKTLTKNHTELVNVIQQEFATTRQLLKNEFERLIKEGLQPIHQALNQLVDGMEVLHQDLLQVNQHLVKLHQSMDDVKGLIEKNTDALEQLHQDLGSVHQAVKAMHQDMNQGYDKQAQMLKQLNHSLQTGFQQVHHDLQLQQQQDAEHHRESLEIQNRLLDTTTDIVSGIDDLGTQITNSTQNQTEALLTQMAEGSAIFKTSQEGILEAIKEQTEQGIVNTNELLSAQNETRQALTEQFQTNLNQVRESVSESSSSCIFFC